MPLFIGIAATSIRWQCADPVATASIYCNPVLQISEALEHMPSLLVLDDLDLLCPAASADPGAPPSPPHADALVQWLSDVLDALRPPDDLPYPGARVLGMPYLDISGLWNIGDGGECAASDQRVCCSTSQQTVTGSHSTCLREGMSGVHSACVGLVRHVCPLLEVHAHTGINSPDVWTTQLWSARRVWRRLPCRLRCACPADWTVRSRCHCLVLLGASAC